MLVNLTSTIAAEIYFMVTVLYLKGPCSALDIVAFDEEGAQIQSL